MRFHSSSFLSWPVLVLLSMFIPIGEAETSPQAPGVLGAYVRGPHLLIPETPAAFRIATHFATSPEKSTPVAGAVISIALSGNHGKRSAEVFTGHSDASGLLDAHFQVPAWPPGEYEVTVSARLGAQHELVTQKVLLGPQVKLLLQSDKPLYQPGQVLHLKVLGMRTQDMHPLPEKKVRFDVQDPRKNIIFRETRTLSAYGIAAVDLKLASELLLGKYQASVTILGSEDAENTSANLELEVARYSLPKFQIALQSSKPYYLPGERAQLSIEGKYFHGKPTALGKYTIQATLGSERLVTLHGALDQEGRAHPLLELPKTFGPGREHDAEIELRAEVEDQAAHLEETRSKLLFSNQPLLADLVAEAGVLVLELPNQLWIVATQPDGQPFSDVEVSLESTTTKEPASLGVVRTDALGLARFSYTPMSLPTAAAKAAGCKAGEVSLHAHLTAKSGHRLDLDRCLPLAEKGGLLLRTDRAIYPLGAPIELSVLSKERTGVVYIDVLRDKQMVATHAVPLADGRGKLTISGDPRWFGTLALQAYRISESGQRTTDTRLIYVERPAALKIEVHPQKDNNTPFRPGESGRIHLRVVDAASGAGVQAALGMVMVDEALLALRPLRAGMQRTYFTLAAFAQAHSDKKTVRPGGYSLEKLVEESDLDALRQEAAKILLAGAAPPWDQGWESDPWARRLVAKDQQLARLERSVQRFRSDGFFGERVPGKPAVWRYRRDLIFAMIDGGALPARDARDPWNRPVTTEMALQAAGLPEFSELAIELIDERLSAVYALLSKEQSKLPADPRVTGKRAARSLESADLERWAEEKRIARGRLIDPWGHPFRFHERRVPFEVQGVWSRYILASAGPDGVPGTKDDLYARDASHSSRGCACAGQPAVVGVSLAEAFSDPGLYGCGCGYGGALAGHMSSHMGHAASVVMGSASLGGWEDGKGRVRSNFPETMLWQPEIESDKDGNATLAVEMADSITTWRLVADAVARDGRLGLTSASIRVFQDFFVDLDLPPVATQHDELWVPVAVHNYLPTRQRVALELDAAPWFESRGPRTQDIELAPSEVGVRYFPIRVLGVGTRSLRVFAKSDVARDAIERSIEISPDGIEEVHSFQDRLAPGAVEKRLEVPANIIPETSQISLKIYPSPSTHVLEGLESMLRVPHGCFEQTSSTTYPNALILQYLRMTGKNTPELEKKALGYLREGYQRLLSFEVRGGGFSWFGDAPANQVLTAYGLEEFVDMAKVMTIDPNLISRVQRWLAAHQEDDGSFAPDSRNINDGATNRYTNDRVRITAYIALALRRSGGDFQAVKRAAAYVRKKLAEHRSSDPYTLALVTELLSSTDDAGNEMATLLSQLWQARHEEQEGCAVSFAPGDKTLTHGSGKSAIIETTAMAASTLMQLPNQLARVDQAMSYLLSAKDQLGNWHSTQATIRTLKALLSYQKKRGQKSRGTLDVLVDDKLQRQLAIDSDRDGLHSLDLPTAATTGGHRVKLQWNGSGELAYQLIARSYRPVPTPIKTPISVENLPTEPHPNDPELAVATIIDEEELKMGDKLYEQVRVSARHDLDMPIITAGVPPGFTVSSESLDELVRSRRISKYEISPRAVVFYLNKLAGSPSVKDPTLLGFYLTARFPVRAAIPASTVYEYYQPENLATSPTRLITVRQSN